jgi:hypothetical protein
MRLFLCTRCWLSSYAVGSLAVKEVFFSTPVPVLHVHVWMLWMDRKPVSAYGIFLVSSFCIIPSEPQVCGVCFRLTCIHRTPDTFAVAVQHCDNPFLN